MKIATCSPEGLTCSSIMSKRTLICANMVATCLFTSFDLVAINLRTADMESVCTIVSGAVWQTTYVGDSVAT